MDLSKILSPALEEEERPLRESNRGWSADELQCAVAILQDFQQPCVEPPEKAQHDVCDTNDAKYFVKHEQKEEDKVIKRAIDDNGRVHQEGRRNTGIAGQQQTSLVDSMSKLDLLVEADAIIKHHRSKTPTDDKPQHMRSGVWSRAEEEYAAALVAYFLKGLLDLPEGVTLRKFVAEKLCCNRRRVSMKLGTGSLAGQKIPKKVGASVFVAADPPPSNEQRQEIESALKALRGASFDSGLWNSARNYDEGEDHNNQQHKLLKLHEDDHDSNESRPFNKLMRKKKASLRPKRGKPTIIRTGFESPEEEEFVTAMVEYFVDGSLDLPEGTKLVRYLCQQLGCTPMQLSMKLAPRRTGERKFPDNVGSIRYMRKVKGGTSLHDDEFPEELFEVESRITELRLAHEEAHKNIPSPEATPIKRERKVSMASVSSSGTASSPSASPVRSFQRSGPWSHDEEVYAAALIEYFFKGVLEISEGTTLRAFLSSRLCCNPMRISKKLASECIAEIRIPKKIRKFGLRA